MYRRGFMLRETSTRIQRPVWHSNCCRTERAQDFLSSIVFEACGREDSNLNSSILTGAPTVSGNTEFELRVRQAILSAKHTIPQVAVLLFGFNLKGGNQPGENTGWQSSILMRLRGGLRDSDTVALLPD